MPVFTVILSRFVLGESQTKEVSNIVFYAMGYMYVNVVFN